MSTRDLNSYRSFREWFYENIDDESLRTICYHGARAGIGGLCCYSETTALFNAFKSEIEELATFDYDIDLWEIAKQSDARGITQLINAIVWRAAERMAHICRPQLTGKQEESDTEVVSEEGDDHEF